MLNTQGFNHQVKFYLRFTFSNLKEIQEKKKKFHFSNL